MKATDNIRQFWRRATFEEARDECVTSPPNPLIYNDQAQDEYLKSLLGFRPTGSVLDYGCGVGRVTRALLRAGCYVTALDVSPEMLTYCATYCNRNNERWRDKLKLVLSDGYGCPSLPNDHYDGVICLYVLQHAHDELVIAAALATLERVVKPRGWIIVQTTEHGHAADGGMFGVPCAENAMQQHMPHIEWTGRYTTRANETFLTGKKT